MSEERPTVFKELSEEELLARDALWLRLSQEDPSASEGQLRALCARSDALGARRLLGAPLGEGLSAQAIERALLGALSAGRLELASALAERPGLSERAVGLALTTGFLLNHHGLLDGCARSLPSLGELAEGVLKGAYGNSVDIATKQLHWDDEVNQKPVDALNEARARFEALLMAQHLAPGSASKPQGL